MTFKRPLAVAITLALYSQYSLAEQAETLDKMVIEGETSTPVSTHYTSPSTMISDIEVESINATTVEDFVKYEPSLVLRRRYIGDSNGTVGIRGSNMFQTTRAMVFADGLPLHYLLESQWNGAPRWSIVAPSETKSVEVIYGPFSAEYSGNAMGGVINIETKLPEKPELHVESSLFAQDFKHLGANDTYTGHREFVSFGSRYEDLSVYFFHNHLDNNSQPMTFRYGASTTPVGGETEVTGAYAGVDSINVKVMNYADTGSDKVITDLTKFKAGYDFGNWKSLLTFAYENLTIRSKPTNYLMDSNGDAVWNGDVMSNGTAFSVKSSNFVESEKSRRSALVGINLEGPLKNAWVLNTNVSYFNILKDKTLTSGRHPDDPAYNEKGRVKEFDNTGWKTVDVKVRTEQFMQNKNLNLVAGLHSDNYTLTVNDYNSDDYLAGVKTSQRTSTGGETSTKAVFAQLGWDFMPMWDVALGGRYEHWKMNDGFYHKIGGDIENYSARTETGFSPKMSLGFTPDSPWKIRYSLARAYRFPIVEELFKNEEATNSTSIADQNLKPEVGIHHNLTVEQKINRGFVRINLYQEQIEDVIFSQSITLADSSTVSTFLPIDEVSTKGLELVVQQTGVMESNLDVRFNVNYTQSEITEHSTNPSLEGKVFPRMPKARANMLLTYNFTPQWDAATGIRYASNSFGNLDNSDTAEDVYGAQDGYTFVDLKANYRPTQKVRIGFGVDNVGNELAFVAHPWPLRTYYAEASIDF